MADHTKIEWTDATWNPITGCSVVSPGCTNCYAMRLAGTRLKHHPSRTGLTRDTNARGAEVEGRQGSKKINPVWTGEVRFNEQWLDQPLRWTRPRMIFVCAHGDLFAEGVPDEWIDRVFAVMALCPQHTFQVLTKRPERMRQYLSMARANPVGLEALEITLQEHSRDRNSTVGAGCKLKGDIPHLAVWPLPNVWLGVSVEDQRRADERVPILLETPAAVRWVSAEPLLGPIDFETAWHGESALASECWGDCAWCDKGLTPLHNCHRGRQSDEALHKGRSGLDWIVAGGESGPGARPMHPDWVRSIREQCADAGVPFLFKQWGQWATAKGQPGHMKVGHVFEDGYQMIRLKKKAAGRLLDGVEHNGYPTDDRQTTTDAPEALQ